MINERFQIVHEEIISTDNDLIQNLTVIAEGKTKAGLLKFAKMKKLDKDKHFLERCWYEVVQGIPIPESEYINHLNMLI